MNLENPLDRNILFYTDVAQETIGELTGMILNIESHDLQLKKHAKSYGFKYKPEPIKFFINSYGGDAYACLGLVSIMKNCTTPIHTYVSGCAMSAGFILAINGHKRFCYNNSSYMWHQLSSSAIGKLQEQGENIIESDRIQKLLDQVVFENTNLNEKDLKKLYRGKKDKFFSAQRALELGIVDKIL